MVGPRPGVCTFTVVGEPVETSRHSAVILLDVPKTDVVSMFSSHPFFFSDK